MYPKEDHVDLGTTLTDYQLCDYISKGSNAAVYHALHPNKGTDIFLQCLNANIFMTLLFNGTVLYMFKLSCKY